MAFVNHVQAYTHARVASLQGNSTGAASYTIGATGLIGEITTAPVVRNKSIMVGTLAGLCSSNIGGAGFFARYTDSSNLTNTRQVRGIVRSGDGRIYAGLGGSPGYLARSTDDGKTFSTTSLGESLAGNVYVNASGHIFVAVGDGMTYQLLKSTDGGLTFTSIFSTTDYGFDTIAGSPDGKLFIATSSGLGVSTDGGATFNLRNTTHGLLANMLMTTGTVYYSGSKLYVGSGSGLQLSNDNGATFSTLHAFATSKVFVTGTSVLSGSGTSLRRSTDSGASFSTIAIADGVQSLFQDGDGNIYVGTTSGGLQISTDGGATFVARKTTEGLLSNSFVRAVLVYDNE
jgi:photosystem II stability/assembly factor-like uncharacterized protein